MSVDRAGDGAALAAAAIVSVAVNVTPELAWYLAGALFVLVLVMMTADILTGWLAAPDRAAVDLKAEAVGKFLLILLVPVSLLTDVAIYVLASLLPRDFAILSSGFLFVTITTTAWLFAAELAEVVKNISTHQGRERVPPTLGWLAGMIMAVVKSFQKVDRARWRESHHDGSLPPGRWMDEWLNKYTEQEMAELIEKVMAMKQEEVPADPEQIINPKQEE